MIEIRELTKKFGNDTVLDGIDLTIETGEMFGIIGRSGAGKSTLLRCINGLETYDGGSVIVDGVDVKSLSYREMLKFRKNVGMIFQQFSLLERLSIIDNVALQMKFWRVPKNKARQRAYDLLEMVGLTEKAQAFPNELSGGQKQRVAIARALTMDPQILLCDEATSALDPSTSKSIIALLNSINREMKITVVIVTHEMSVIKSSCDRMSIIENGKLARTGPVEEVFVEQSPPLLRLLGESDIDFPKTGCNYKIILTAEHAGTPLITDMGKELGINILVLGGDSERFKYHTLGTIYLNVAEQDKLRVEEYLNAHDIVWRIAEEDGRMME